jgi:hypothetical protein
MWKVGKESLPADRIFFKDQSDADNPETQEN